MNKKIKEPNKKKIRHFCKNFALFKISACIYANFIVLVKRLGCGLLI